MMIWNQGSGSYWNPRNRDLEVSEIDKYASGVKYIGRLLSTENRGLESNIAINKSGYGFQDVLNSEMIKSGSGYRGSRCAWIQTSGSIIFYNLGSASPHCWISLWVEFDIYWVKNCVINYDAQSWAMQVIILWYLLNLLLCSLSRNFH